MPISKKLFLGIMTSQEIKKQIKDFQEKNRDLPVKWTSLDDLHITLVPPFCTIELDKLISVLDNYNFSKPFNIKSKLVSYGPDKENPRLIWLLIQESENLYNLKKEIYQSLNLKLPEQAFLPHITLAKFKYLDKKDLEIKFENIDIVEKVQHFDLIQTIEIIGGSKYISKGRFYL
ncbi:MAG TPA: RNA 2',3'-cyclic phosphodiesterase [Patescibacteria group bacterium]|nr:RNA 2',3'-cyclic phosphodiesterase [Patescibacteria group bacterium]